MRKTILSRALAALGLSAAIPTGRYGARTLVPAFLVVFTDVEHADIAACDAAMEFNANQRRGRNEAVLYLCEASVNTPIDDHAEVPGTLSGLTCDAGAAERVARIGPLVRTAASPLTIAYIAKGAGDFIRDLKAGQIDGYPADAELAAGAWEGELEFMDAVVSHALELDRRADVIDQSGGFMGVFAYEVAEPFGYGFAKALHVAGRSSEKPSATKLMDSLLTEACT